MNKWIAVLLLLVLSYVGVIATINLFLILIYSINLNQSDKLIYIGSLILQLLIMWLCYKGIRYFWKSIRKNIEKV